MRFRLVTESDTIHWPQLYKYIKGPGGKRKRERGERERDEESVPERNISGCPFAATPFGLRFSMVSLAKIFGLWKALIGVPRLQEKPRVTIRPEPVIVLPYRFASIVIRAIPRIYECSNRNNASQSSFNPSSKNPDF